jgi:hypothetical protein
MEPRRRGCRLGGALLVGDQGLHQPLGEQPRSPEVGDQHPVELAGPDVQHALPGGDPDVVDHRLEGPGDEVASWAVGACHYKA